MGEDTMPREETQANFIQNELNFNINPDDSVIKDSSDPPADEWDILGNNQLRKKVIQKGKDGTRPNRGDLCILNITGKLVDSGKIVERMDNFTIQLGDMDVVQGLDLAIALMDVGEIAEIIVDPRFGYGKRGSKPVPPNAVILYTVELKETVLEPAMETISLNTRRKIGIKKRERGNWWFVHGEPTIAIQCYRRALQYLANDYYTKDSVNQNELVDDTVLQCMLEDCIKVHNNLAAALIKTEAYDTALENVEVVLRHQPRNEKALYRKGRILKLKGEYTKAYAIFAEVQKINPDMAIIHTELMNLKEKIAKNTKKEKYLYRKMLGISNECIDSSDNAKIQDKSKIAKGLLWTLVVGGASAAIIGILIHRFTS